MQPPDPFTARGCATGLPGSWERTLAAFSKVGGFGAFAGPAARGMRGSAGWQHGGVSSRPANPQPLSCAGKSRQRASKNIFFGAGRKPQGGSGLGRVPVSRRAAGAKALCSLSKQTARHRGPVALGQRFPLQHPRFGELRRRQRVKAALRFTI